MQPVASDFQITKTVRLQYLLHLPPDARTTSNARWPLILFLHGRGESGDDIEAVRREGLPPIIAQQPDFPFITVAPQCPWHTWWPELAEPLDMLLNQLTASYPVDSQRIYLTGLSMGGYGTWHLGSLWPGRFAALAPICGGGYWFHGFPERVCALCEVPVWAFHGAKDDIVPLAESERLVESLRGCGGNVRLTVYPDAAHDSWTATYRNPELYTWLSAQRRA
jgi:predicted peptidase